MRKTFKRYACFHTYTQRLIFVASNFLLYDNTYRCKQADSCYLPVQIIGLYICSLIRFLLVQLFFFSGLGQLLHCAVKELGQ